MPEVEPFSSVIMRLLRAGGVFFGHLCLGFFAMVGVWATERGFALLFRTEDPKFFDYVPVWWFFDAGEGGILLVFVVFGIFETVRQLRR